MGDSITDRKFGRVGMQARVMKSGGVQAGTNLKPTEADVKRGQQILGAMPHDTYVKTVGDANAWTYRAEQFRAKQQVQSFSTATQRASAKKAAALANQVAHGQTHPAQASKPIPKPPASKPIAIPGAKPLGDVLLKPGTQGGEGVKAGNYAKDGVRDNDAEAKRAEDYTSQRGPSTPARPAPKPSPYATPRPRMKH